MDEQEDSGWVTTFSIEHMTVDLFQFWLERDWEVITSGLHLLSTSATEEDGSPYIRHKTVIWSSGSSTDFVIPRGLFIIAFAQMKTDVIRVEISGIDMFTNKLLEWVRKRFGTSAETEKETPQFQAEPSTDGLTKAEKKVATYLAKGLSYKEIAEQVKRSEGTIKTHAQSIADKWGCRRIPEILWLEAQKRLY